MNAAQAFAIIDGREVPPRLCLCGCGQEPEAFDLCQRRGAGRRGLTELWFAKGHAPASWNIGKKPQGWFLKQLERMPRTQLGLLCRRAYLNQFVAFRDGRWAVLDVSIERALPPKMPAAPAPARELHWPSETKAGVA